MTYRLGKKLFLNLFFSAFWTPVSSLRRKKVKLGVQWVVGSLATARDFLTIARSVS